MKCKTGSQLRVLMTADTVGGVWTYAIELTRALGEYGVKVALATMGAPLNAVQCEEARRVPTVELFESDFRLEWMEQPWDDVGRAGEWLLRIEERFRPHVIHLNSYAHGTLPWRSPVMMVGHSCVLSWWQAVKNEAAPDSWNHYRRAVTGGLGAAGLVAAPSKSMLAALDEHYGPLPARRVIYNGRRIDRNEAVAKEPFILAAGRLWDEAKNIAALERVAPRLSWPVYVAGEKKSPDGRAAPIDSLRLLGRLAQTDLTDWMAYAAIYALPARYEPFGLSVLEAAQAGCALVLGDIASLREVWGGAAVFVPPDDAEALAAALESLIRGETRRRSLAALARARARRYTPERMAMGYLAAYAELLGKGIEQIKGEPACES